MTPKNGMKIEAGDAIAFWVTSTDKAGNDFRTGKRISPKVPALRIMEFLGIMLGQFHPNSPLDE